jgi:hypothetical protein
LLLLMGLRRLLLVLWRLLLALWRLLLVLRRRLLALWRLLLVRRCRLLVLWCLLLVLCCRLLVLRRRLLALWYLLLVLRCRLLVLRCRLLVLRLLALCRLLLLLMGRRAPLLRGTLPLWRRMLGLLMLRTLCLRLFLLAALSCGRLLLGLLEMLAHYLVTRLVMVLLAAYGTLLLRPGIPVSCILALVAGERSWPWCCAAVPVVPAAPALLPGMAPVITPTRRRIRTPAAEIRGGLPVVTDGDAQDIQRH